MFKKYVNLFDLKIADISLAHATELARESMASGESRTFFTPNLEMLERARKSEEIRELLNSASILLPDGVGLRLSSRLIGTPVENKVPGIDFGERLIALAEENRARVFLLGGRSGVAKRAGKRLLKKHPRLLICGIHSGYFDSEEENEIIKKIQRARPDFLIVCMGFPRQESLVAEHKREFACIKVIACLGGALDVWSGRKKRAPLLLRRMNLEWAWRIAFEPKRALRFFKSLPTLAWALNYKFKKTINAKELKRKTTHIFK